MYATRHTTQYADLLHSLIFTLTNTSHRYLTDGVTTLPMGLLSRLMATNDTLMALVPLVDQPPWVRRRCVRLAQAFFFNNSESSSMSKMWE